MLWLIEKYMRWLARFSERFAARVDAYDPGSAEDMRNTAEEIRRLERPKRRHR